MAPRADRACAGRPRPEGRPARSGGLARRRPLIAALFAIPALSLAGLPPFSGFIAKLSVISAGIDSAHPLVVAAALIAGALTLLSMTMIWLAVFWGPAPEPEELPSTAPETAANRRLMRSATGLAVAGTLFISLFAGTVFDLSERAAEDLRRPDAYREAVQS